MRAAGYLSSVLVGSGIPELRKADLQAAFDSLDGSDAVVGPTRDGGYYLIGMHKPFPEPFGGKSYGHDKVADDLLAAAHAAGIGLGLAAILFEYGRG